MRSERPGFAIWLRALVCAGALGTPWASEGDPRKVVPEPSLSLPSAGTPFADPAFGTTSERLVDAKAAGYGMGVPEYSNLQAWNANMRLLMLRTKQGHILFDAKTLQERGAVPGGAQAVRWSPSNPDLLCYLRDQDNPLFDHHVSTKAEEVLWTFSE